MRLTQCGGRREDSRIMERSAADWLAEGDAHYDARRWNEAGLALERALALAPLPSAAQARAWYRLGNVREEQGRDSDAEACFEKAVALDPVHAQAWNNLGGARQRLRREQGAIEAYRKAIAADAGLAQPHLNLGRLYSARGDQALAAECFSMALERHPGDATFEHLLAAVRGKSTARAPRAYVTGLFDGLASQFEQHLVRDLDYHVPEAIAQWVRPVLEAAAPARALDLGCGTGLLGAALAATGAQLVGADLSPRMLEIAARRGVYARLEEAELEETLRRTAPGSMHAVLAADVFVYFGDLETVFQATARALAPGGVFAFSVEASENASYRLQPNGRYAHSPGYLRALAALAGLEPRRLERARIRRDAQGYAEGWLALFVRPAASKTTAA